MFQTPQSRVWQTIYFFTVLYLCGFLKSAYAYLDPGSGSYLYQIILAFLLAFPLAFKGAWKQIWNFFKKFRKKPSPPESK